MTTSKEPLQGSANTPADQHGSPIDSDSLQLDPQPAANRGKLLAELSEFFSHRRHQRGIFLPLVRIDRAE